MKMKVYLKKKKISRAGFDAAKETYLSGKQMRTAGLVELPSLISRLRETKDSDELKKMRQANRIAYLAYEYVKPRIKTGMMECEVASMLEQFMRMQGAWATSFATIVAFGENAANPHHETGTRKLKKEDAVSITSIYLISYSIIRFADEYLRGDVVRGLWGPFSTSQWISLAILIGTVIVLIVQKTRTPQQRLT